MTEKPRTLVDLLLRQADTHPDKLAYAFSEGEDVPDVTITYSELDHKVRAIAAELYEAGGAGERALLLYPPGLDFIAAFLGCLYAGVTAVPAYPPRLNRPMPRIEAIVRDADARFALTTGQILDSVEKRFEHEPLLQTLRWRNTELTSDERARGWTAPDIRPDRLAFLQYTSGSTSTPKGVMVTHANLIANLEMIRRAFHLDGTARGTFWLPSYHDMGLIGGILEPLYLGGSSLLISPIAFLQRPYRWLQAITDFRATTTGAPNFAFDLCVDKITDEQKETLDLSSLKLCFSGAEPIRTATLERFAAAFSPHGFSKATLYPCYGLAEATLLVSGGDGPGKLVHRRLDREALQADRAEPVGDGAPGQDFIGSGQAMPGERIVIVDPDIHNILPEDAVGEIWVQGDNVAAGYWGRPESSAATFEAVIADTREGPFLRTGDLGFLSGGELFITGRLKDLIIIRGRNHYPQDIEMTAAAAHEAVEGSAVAAFSYERDGEERLAIVAEAARRHRDPDMDAVAAALRRAVAESHGLQLDAFLLVKPLSIPKTSSGKIKRHAARQAFLDADLIVVGEWTARGDPAMAPTRERETPPADSEPILAWLVEKIAAAANLDPARIDPDEPFVVYGIDSAQAVALTGDLETHLGRNLSPTLAWDYPTPRQLAAFLAGGPVSRTAPPASGNPGMSSDEPVAVVGMACRFPGAPDVEAFWNLLTHGIDAIEPVPPDRFDAGAVYDPAPATPGKLNTRWGGFLRDIDRFDPGFFGISPREAARMDPQQRLLLEVAWEALEAAGIPPDRLAGSPTGVYVGISSYDYSQGQFDELDQLDIYANTGNAHSIAANRLSYFLDLRGPSVAVDTACSSSLVATHLACTSLRSGESDLALAGGVNLILTPHLTISFSQGRAMASDGRCKSFDARADGYVRSEGAGMVVLKRLSDAQRDGDPILAVIRGSAINQDGRTNGLTAPNGRAQVDVIRRALNRAGAGPEEIGYVEAHGTGTPLGDPIEMHALRDALAAGRAPDRPLFVGSVKTNIGHAESAAGIAGLIKAVLVVHRGEIPPNLHFNELNPYISLDGSPVRVPERLTAWPIREGQRLAGVSSFGFGGTNAHVIIAEPPLREWPEGEREDEPERPAALLAISAHSPEALRDLAARYVESDLPDLSGAAFTSQVGRTHFDHRFAVAAGDPGTAKKKLEAFVESRGEIPGVPPKIAFLFSGNGAQYPAMARQLYRADPHFREAVEACATAAEPELDTPLLDLLLSDDARIREVSRGQPALFAFEYAAARMWAAWGIRPDYLLGHSLGEWAAACFAGVFSLEDALRLVIRRSRLMEAAPGKGGMLTVVGPVEEVVAAIAPSGDRLAVADITSRKSLTVSGDLDAIREAAGLFAARGWAHRAVDVAHGFHSYLMDPVVAAFRPLMSDVALYPPGIPIAANSDGDLRGPERPFERDYWVDQIRNTIDFSAGIETLIDRNVDVFLDLSPKPNLLGMARRVLRSHNLDKEMLATASETEHDWGVTLESLGSLYELGVDVDWVAFNRGVRAEQVRLPAYPFQRERHWFSTGPRPGSADRSTARAAVSTLRRLPVAVPVFETRLDRINQPDLLELVLAAAAQAFEAEGSSVREIRFTSAEPVEGPAEIQVVFSLLKNAEAGFSLHVRSGETWRNLAEGVLLAGARADRTGPAPSRAPVEKAETPTGPAEPAPGPGPDVQGFIRSQVAATLGLPPDRLRPDQALNRLGLDSLMAIEVRNAVERHFGVEIPIVEIVEGPTLEKLAALVTARLDAHELAESIRVDTGPGPHPLTYGQRAMWFLHELTGEDASFNIAGAVRVAGDFDVDRLRTALEILMRRHPALTHRFGVVDGEPVQEAVPGAAAPLVEVDASDWSRERIDGYLKKEAWRKFNLAAGPPFRVRVLRTAGQGETGTHLLLLAIDHIVGDFWSVSLIVRDLIEAYTAGAVRDPVELRYVDVARWLNDQVDAAGSEAHLEYWRSRLSGGPPALDLPADRPRPPLLTYQGDTVFRRLPADIAGRLADLALAQGTTLFNVLLAAFQALLHRYTGREELLVGSVMAGRDHPDLDELVGYLINPVALKADFSDGPTFLELLAQVRTTVLGAFEHQNYPPPLLAERLDLPRDHSRPPLFETMFIFQKAQVMDEAGLAAFAIGLPGSRVTIGDLEMEIHTLEGHPAQFDLTLMMAEAEGTLLSSLQYSTALFEKDTVERLLAHLEALLAGIAADPGRPVAEYPLMPAAEREQLAAWNRAARRDFPPGLTLVELVAAGLEKGEGKTAVVFGGRTLTHNELDERSDRLAAHLQSLGVGPGRLVGVHMRRSLELPVALLGILKSGGAYVPLDPAFPPARIDFMVSDSGLDLVLADAEFTGRFPDHVRTIDPRGQWPVDSPQSPVGSHPAPGTRHQSPDDLAYVIYTSGSTGFPKGVRIPHRAAANFLMAMIERPGLSADDVLYAVTTLSFDISVLELFLPLAVGATVAIAAEEAARDAPEMIADLERTGANVMQATPSTWRLLLEAGWDGDPALKALCGGEALPRSLAEALLPVVGELWNMYGPTETTVWSTVQRVEPGDGPVGIGTPIANTTVHILDAALRPVPIGVFGELCLGGDGLAAGYLDRPELTREKFITLSEKFIDLPAAGEHTNGKAARVYRTGDLARLRADGTLEFVGRIDSQVKLRGYRIELGEIESVMARFEGVRQAVAAVQTGGDGGGRLVGFVVPENGTGEFPEAGLRRHLGRYLPEYMVPAQFVALEALPLTPNGKIDRKALPEPDGARPVLETEYVAPRDEIEERLAALCAESLGLDRIGIRDNFFDLGGTSLQATRLVFQVREAFGVQVLLRSLFEDPTVEGLAAAIEAALELSGRGYGVLEKKKIEELLADVVLDDSITAGGREWEPAALGKILLTGATGYLGAFLLRELLDETEAEIACLVRADNAEAAMDRIRRNMEGYGQWDEAFHDRIVALPGDLDRPGLGQSEADFTWLAEEIDVIFHNGALVSFIQTYDGHKPANVGGTAEILRLASTGKLKPVHYVSTLSVFHTGDHGGGHVYEESEDLVETGVPLGGYAQSKWVAEKMVEEAARRGIPAAIYRPGVISGHSETGAWNHTDLVWGLARACFTLGKIPELEGRVDVVPVDYVSRTIVHLSLNETPDGRVYHLGNPETYPYAEMVALIQRLGLPADPVPFDDWREALFRKAMEGEAGEWSAFLPIIEEVEVEQIFMPAFDVSNTLKGLEGSGISCPPVGEELLGHYLRFFNEVGFF
jgi:amino acid adenylation domain-containing protein/thioester reductase-like protein